MKDVMIDFNGKKWSVRTTGSSKSLKLFNTQKEAAAYGIKIAKKNKSEFRMKDKNGKVREKHNYKLK